MKILEKVNIRQIWSKRPYHTGLALSGGGAKGFAHIGVLMAMEKNGLKPDVLAGVSAGSVVAVLYAAGLSPRDIIECFGAYSGFSDFTNLTIPKTSFFRLDKFAKIFESWLPVKYMEKLDIPTVICATDIEAGKSKGWWKGEITPRVMASCCVPIVFAPIEIDGRNYIDGGVLRNLPAWAIRKQCDTLIGSHCSPLSDDYTFKASLPAVAMRTYSLMSKSNTLQDILLCDVMIRHAAVAKVSTFDMSEMRSIVLKGYDTAMPVIEKMLKS